ncbi:MAG: lactate utilization protein [Desulfobacterales bacterium]|jgi:L-lactate utilization protein LutB
MDNPVDRYWQLRLTELKAVLELNNFTVYRADSAKEAADLVQKRIVAEIAPKSISWGGSMTFVATGLYDALKSLPGVEVIDAFDKNASAEEILDRRRRSLLVDLFVTGCNAVTETGLLVNLDMIGNRIGGLTFGPRHVVLLVGRNKVVPDVEEAMARIKNFVAPANAMRLDKKTPCVKTGFCENCSSPDRICNTWTITEKSFPKGRIKIVLINENLGL